MITVKRDTSWLPGRTVTIRDSIPYPVKIYVQGKPYPVTVTDTVWLTQEANIDTSAIVADYFKTRQYADTIRSDSSYVALSESVNQNKLFGRQVVFHISERQISTTTMLAPRNEWYGGVGFSTFPGAYGAGPELNLHSKSSRLYRIGIYYTTLNTFRFNAGFAIKLSK